MMTIKETITQAIHLQALLSELRETQLAPTMVHTNCKAAYDSVKDVGGNPKDPLIWISAYMIYMAYTYKGGVYVGKEAPSGTKGPT